MDSCNCLELRVLRFESVEIVETVSPLYGHHSEDGG